MLRFVTLLLGLSVGPLAFAQCEFDVEVGDGLFYSVTDIAASKDCESVTINLNHTGNLQAVAMGHNWVLSRTEDFADVAMVGMSAGFEGNYLPPEDDRVLASTKIIGGGESTSVTFSIAELDASQSYTFFCSFPGHSSVMKGSFTLT